MPRAVKQKVADVPAKKAVPAKKGKSKLYAMPEKIPEGTVLTDITKTKWRIGPSIGIGGFGEIYAACKVGEKNFDAVVKCEPHGNGPLFVEMHFYLRNAKQDDLKKFKQKHGIKSLGMPYILANGSEDVNGEKHRFIVMPRYGSDISKLILANGKRLPEGTAYRLAIQMLDVYQYIHGTGYVHADLKASNILLGLGKGGGAQAYLVDFGLASHFVTGDFKPDPKKMHNGTIEYTSRDAHLGVPTRRADLEILGYNLIEWLGVELPWVKQKLLAVPLKVQKAKEAFMSDIGGSLKALFPKGVPAPIGYFMKYVAQLSYKDEPNYDNCRTWFANALKQMKIPDSGDLDFKLKSQTSSNNNNNSPPGTSKAAAPSRGVKREPSPQSDEEISASDDEEEKEVIPPKKARNTPTVRAAKVSPRKRAIEPDTPPSQKRIKTEPNGTSKTRSSPRGTPKATPMATPKATKKATPKVSPTRTPSAAKQQTPNASAKINFSPANSLRGRPGGKTVINDDLTPNPLSKKTYEFNFELDVSMDANVIVNVKRKKKAAKDQAVNTPKTPSSRSLVSSKEEGTPVTRVNLRKVKEDGSESPSTSGRSPRTPAVILRKYQR
ncbi:hypothetical protein KR009_006455 [Drosophila setifemur]|nr:hypothetical protein KR009_006455 [Drosophila setifemur]